LWLVRAGVPAELAALDWMPVPVLPPVPRRFCDPVDAFGDPDAPHRIWLPPVDSESARQWLEFREAVLQHALCIAVRRHERDHGVPRARLAQLDGRPNAESRWNAVLTGRRLMTMEDVALLLLHCPDAFPAPRAVAALLAAAGQSATPPQDRGQVKGE
jgi:hypothetical protein